MLLTRPYSWFARNNYIRLSCSDSRMDFRTSVPALIGEYTRRIIRNSSRFIGSLVAFLHHFASAPVWISWLDLLTSRKRNVVRIFFSHMPLSWNYFYLHVLRSSVGNACLKKLSYPRLVTHECLLYYRLYNYVKVSMWAWFLPDEKCGVSAWLSRGLVGRSSAKRRNAFFEQCRSSWTVKSTT